jgi:hypothetical protein
VCFLRRQLHSWAPCLLLSPPPPPHTHTPTPQILTPRKLYLLASRVAVFPSAAISLVDVAPRYDDAKGAIYLEVRGWVGGGVGGWVGGWHPAWAWCVCEGCRKGWGPASDPGGVGQQWFPEGARRGVGGSAHPIVAAVLSCPQG